MKLYQIELDEFSNVLVNKTVEKGDILVVHTNWEHLIYQVKSVKNNKIEHSMIRASDITHVQTEDTPFNNKKMSLNGKPVFAKQRLSNNQQVMDPEGNLYRVERLEDKSMLLNKVDTLQAFGLYVTRSHESKQLKTSILYREALMEKNSSFVVNYTKKELEEAVEAMKETVDFNFQ